MEKYAWKAYFKEDCKEEYCKRHNEIWPEMVEVLKSAGIKNYTIWNVGNELFGYYECEKGIEHATKVQSESPVVKKMGRIYEGYSYYGDGPCNRCSA